MAQLLTIGNCTVTRANIIPLLASYKMLPQLCRELIIDSAITGIELSPEERANAKEHFCQQHQLTTPAQQQAWLQHYGMTPQQLAENATRELKIEKFKIATWGAKIESYFLTYKPQLDQIIYSLIRTKDTEIAQELFFRIQASEQSFAECARQYSIGPEAQTEGLIGPVPISQSHPVIAQKLATSQPGQLLPPMRIEDWIVLVRLEKLIPAQLDDAMRDRLLNHLFEIWLTEQISLEIASLGLGESEQKAVQEMENLHLTSLPHHLDALPVDSANTPIPHSPALLSSTATS